MTRCKCGQCAFGAPCGKSPSEGHSYYQGHQIFEPASFAYRISTARPRLLTGAQNIHRAPAVPASADPSLVRRSSTARRRPWTADCRPRTEDAGTFTARFAASTTRALLFPRHRARFATKAAWGRSKHPLAHLYCKHPPLKVASMRDSDVPSYIWTLEPCRLAQVKLQRHCTLLSARFVRCFHLSTIIQPSCIIQHHRLVTNKWCSVGCIYFSNSGAPTLGKISIDKFSAHLTSVCMQLMHFVTLSLPKTFLFFSFLSFISLRPEKHETHSFPI